MASIQIYCKVGGANDGGAKDRGMEAESAGAPGEKSDEEGAPSQFGCSLSRNFFLKFYMQIYTVWCFLGFVCLCQQCRPKKCWGRREDTLAPVFLLGVIAPRRQRSTVQCYKCHGNYIVIN